MKKLLKKKVIIPLVAAVAVVAVAAVAVNVVSASGKVQYLPVETWPVEIADLTSAVSVTGTVESEQSASVYAAVSYTIEAVHVEVGDRVQEGDVLCDLDTAALQSSIAQKQASLSAQQASLNHAVEVAKNSLERSADNVEYDADVTIESAEAAVLTARNSMVAQQHTVADLRKKIRDLREDKLQVPDSSTYDEYIDELQSQLVREELTLENRQQELENAETHLQIQRERKSRDSRETENTGEDTVKTAELNANLQDQYLALQRLQQDLAEAVVKAPASGTVTAVYAEEGATTSGLLFVIEDTENLKVTTKIKEYDIAGVTEGLPVVIKADATGAEEFQGVVSKIYPTSQKDQTGKAVETNNAEFPAEITVKGPSKLRIGMSARLNIITEKKEAVMSVPYESIVEEDGETFVYVAELGDEGVMVARRVAVEPGMENDFSSEIVSDRLQEGDLVILNPAGLEDGMAVVSDSAQLDAVLA